MSTTPVNNEQVYGDYGPFANNAKGLSLTADIFGYMLSFLKPNELAALESVCKNWERFINTQWPKHCQIQMGLSSEINFTEYLPCPSYKDSLKLIFSSILAEDVYRRYVGEIGPVPKIPEAISLKKWNEPDPCDKRTTIGKEYYWMYCPSYIEIEREGVDLDKPDDPNDPEAPRLIQADQSEKKTLKVAVTINNIIEVFKHPKTGNPANCEKIWDQITSQHGNKRLASGWIPMRWKVVGRTLTFPEHQTFAKKHGVTPSQLGHRMLFNFLCKARYNVYPDGVNPRTYALTDTLTYDEQNNPWVSLCGIGGPSGLWVGRFLMGCSNIGAAMTLPVEVQAFNS